MAFSVLGFKIPSDPEQVRKKPVASPGLTLLWVTKKSKDLRYIKFDVCTQETYEAIIALTAHPVEEGVDVVDHARPEPERITVEGFISNKPLPGNVLGSGAFLRDPKMNAQSVALNLPPLPSPFSPTPGGLTRAVTGFVDKLLNPPPSKITVYKPDTALNRAREALILFEEAKTDAALITVVSGMHWLDTMMLERYACTRTAEGGNGATFQVDLKRVRIVKTETVDAPQPAEARGAPSESKGSKAAQATDPKVTTKAKSIAKSLWDGGKGVVGGLGF